MSFRRQPTRAANDSLPGVRPPDNRAARRRGVHPVSPYARGFVLSELKLQWKVDSGNLEMRADQAYRDSCLLFPFAPSENFARACGFDVEKHEGCGCGASDGKTLRVAPTDDVREWNLRVLHELAHALLRKHYPDHTHGDVWALTLMLACPRSAFRYVAFMDHVPDWCIGLRRIVARVVSRAA